MTRLAFASLAFACVAIAPFARADDTKMACVRAYENGQTLKKAHKWREAQEALDLCRSDKCPEALRGDCKAWWKEVDDALPTVVLGARTKDGRDLVDVRVTANGAPLAKKIDGIALPLDPGAHTLRFEADGFQPTEVQVVAREGEKRRKVDAVLEPIAPPKPAAPSPAPSPKPDEEARARPIPTTAYVLGGIGVVGVGAFGYFALSGLSQKSDLDQCKPTCAQSSVDSARRSFLIGDIALGVGVVSLAAAAYVYFSRPSTMPASARVDVSPTSGGAVATVRASF